MQNLALIGSVALIHLLAVMSPGPDFILCIRNALTYSRKTGIWTAVGFGLGMSVHISYCLAGLAILISKSILIFNSIKLLGACYLIWIGIKSLRSKGSTINVSTEAQKVDISVFQAIKMGFLTNVLNPKVTLFFLSLFTLVISPNTPRMVMGIMSLVMIIDTILWFSLVSTLMTQNKIRSQFEKYQNGFSKTFGALLVALGIKVAISER